MSYNGNIETIYLDPVSFVPGGRCAFELDGTKLAYLSNMRLLNVGVVSDANIDYSHGLGAMAIIKNARLMDARTELSALRTLAPLQFFKNCNRTNATNKSEDSFLKRNQLGFEINSADNKVIHLYNPGQANTTAATTDLAYVDCRELFPILNSVPLLPTQVFKNLRIEIEFDAKRSSQILTDITASIDVQRPILAVDITNNPVAVENAVAELMESPVLWQEIEHDNYTINGVDVSGFGVTEKKTQTATNHSLGFKGKFVERLLITKQLQNKTKELNGNAVKGFGGVASSQAVLKQSTQIRLNGSNVFPGFKGVSKPNEMLAMVSDEYGNINSYPGSNLYAWSNNANILDDPLIGGQQSFDCARLGARVADLQVQIQRENINDTSVKAATNDALTVNLYGEVSKILNVSANSYRIVYA